MPKPNPWGIALTTPTSAANASVSPASERMLENRSSILSGFDVKAAGCKNFVEDQRSI